MSSSTKAYKVVSDRGDNDPDAMIWGEFHYHEYAVMEAGELTKANPGRKFKVVDMHAADYVPPTGNSY